MLEKNKPRSFRFGPNFERSFLKNQLNKPETSIIELIINSYDAGATKVEINWPIIDGVIGSKGEEYFTIIDNGQGMSYDEFNKNWMELGYDKRSKSKNNIITLENGIERKIIGRNGRGRIGLFGFSDKYKVTTWKKGKLNSFNVFKTYDEHYAQCNDIEIENKNNLIITSDLYNKHENKEKDVSKLHGTIINCPISNNYVDVETLKTFIIIRFGADPHFDIFVNNEKLDLLDIAEYQEKSFLFDEADKNSKIEIYKVPRGRYNERLKQYQVIWKVKNRTAELNTWKNLNINLNAKNPNENKYAFIVEVDFLEDFVEPDWSGFKDDETIEKIKNIVGLEINDLMIDIIHKSHTTRKKKVLKKSTKVISKLNPIGRKEVGNYLDEIMNKCRSITDKDLVNIISVLTKMEISTRKYDFFEQINDIKPGELDKLTEILDDWSIEDAYIVLDELYERLELVKKLDLLTDDPTTKEVQQLQPLFKTGLWIFGPKYEGTTNFTANQRMNTAMVELFGVKNYHSENSKKRPDFVVLETGTIGVWSSNKYEEDSNIVERYDEVLIIELKKGGSTINSANKYQALEYAKEIVEHGEIPPETKIRVYVLGDKVKTSDSNFIKEGNIKVIPKQYKLIFETAKMRTYDLIDNIKDVKGITDLGDPEINEVLESDQATF